MRREQCSPGSKFVEETSPEARAKKKSSCPRAVS